MILVEGTFWPLVVVGAVPDSGRIPEVVMTVDEDRLWSRADVRLAVVIGGNCTRACAHQCEVFGWLYGHRPKLWQCAGRVAWIIEDDTMRRCAEGRLALLGDRLFRCDLNTFRSVGPALAWLMADDVGCTVEARWQGDEVCASTPA